MRSSYGYCWGTQAQRFGPRVGRGQSRSSEMCVYGSQIEGEIKEMELGRPKFGKRMQHPAPSLPRGGQASLKSVFFVLVRFQNRVIHLVVPRLI